MRIALCYNPMPGTIGEYFRRAFLEMGHTIEQLPIHGFKQQGQPFDLFLRIDDGDYAKDLPAQLKPKAFYAVDTHLNRSFKSIRELSPRYDLVFCAQKQVAEQFPNAVWVPLGCDPKTHTWPKQEQSSDVAFVGNDGGVPRKFILQEMRERYPNSFIGKAPYSEMAQIYARSKIGFHYIECTSPFKDHVSMRVYEVLASGTLLMANALAKGAFETLGFFDRKQLVVYQNPKELFELIDYYLAHPQERQSIAQAGQALVLEQHTYLHRAKAISQLLKERGLVR